MILLDKQLLFGQGGLAKDSLYFHHSTYIMVISVWICKNIPAEIKHILRLSRLMEYRTPEQNFN